MAGSKSPSKQRALRVHGVHNNYDLMLKFGKEPDVVIEYCRGDGRGSLNSTDVYSPHFQVGIASVSGSVSMRKFFGNKIDSMPAAIRWATDTYGNRHWAPSPFGGYIPQHVAEAMRAFLKEQSE